jgi:hypothetical protein
VGRGKSILLKLQDCEFSFKKINGMKVRVIHGFLDDVFKLTRNQ